jgi:hypothetical protein
MAGTSFSGNWGYIVHTVPTQFQVVGLMDVTGDGQPDLIWQNTQTGDITSFELNGVTWTGNWSYIAQPGPSWSVTGLR